MRPGSHHRQTGFTLIEAIMAIVITGILAGIVAVFISGPVQGYVDSVRRAELTDAADVALRRMTRDIRLALPNSLRIRDTTTVGSCAVGTCYIEFIMTSAGGRYRDAGDGSVDPTPLTASDCDASPTPADGPCFVDFATAANVSFDILGAMPANPTIAANDFVAIYNLGEGYNPANAYNYNATTDVCGAGGCNIAKVAAAPSGNTVTLTTNPFAAQSPPLPSPSSRFQIVPGGTQAVTFACPMATGVLDRFWNYGFNAAQPTTFGTDQAQLATGARCAVEYTANATGRNGLLVIQLTISSGDESVTLFQQIHVDNSP